MRIRMRSSLVSAFTFCLFTFSLAVMVALPPAGMPAQPPGSAPDSTPRGGHPDTPLDPVLRQAPSIQALAVVHDRTVYAGSFGMGVFRSDSRGNGWAPVNTGLDDRFILSLAVDQDGTVYAGTLRSGVFRTTNRGKSWQAINDGLSRHQIKTLMIQGGVVYAGTGGGVYRLPAGQTTWVVVTKGLDQTVVQSLVMADDHTLYAGTAAKGVMRFKENGKEWTRVPRGPVDHEGMVENFIRVLALGKDRALYAGTFDGGVFRSADGGQVWQPISRALPNDSIRGIIAGENGLLVATGRGVFRGPNESGRWTSVNTGLTELSVQVLVVSGDGALYAGTSAGAFRSDDGASWVNISEGLLERQSPEGR